MKRIVKRSLVGFLVLLALLACAAGGVWWSAFGHNRPIVDRQVLVPGVEIVKDGFVSVAVIDAAPEHVALIDAGNDKEGTALLAALRERKLEAGSVTAIFLTHGHPDHTAGCHLFPAAKVYGMEADAPLVGSAATLTPLKDGEIVDVGGGTQVQVFATPGHTPGSAVYFARGVLFFGDSARGSKDGQVMQAVRLFSKDPDQNVASLKALAARLQPRAGEVKFLAFAHSGPLDGFQPLAEFASTH